MDGLIVVEISFDLAALRVFEKSSFKAKNPLQRCGLCTYRYFSFAVNRSDPRAEAGFGHGSNRIGFFSSVPAVKQLSFSPSLPSPVSPLKPQLA